MTAPPPTPLTVREQPRWHFCGQCGAAYDPQRGHACDALGFGGHGIVLAAGIGLVFYVLALAVLEARFGWPFR